MHGTLAAPPQDAELGQTLNLKGCTGVLLTAGPPQGQALPRQTEASQPPNS